MADLGYDPRFLDTDLAPPQAPGPRPGEDPALATPLDYVHFTVRMHPERRLAWWVAWNVDGLRLFPSDSISRSGERFRLDSPVYGPYLFADLEGTTEEDEQAAISAGEIAATRVEVVGLLE